MGPSLPPLIEPREIIASLEKQNPAENNFEFQNRILQVSWDNKPESKHLRFLEELIFIEEKSGV